MFTREKLIEAFNNGLTERTVEYPVRTAKGDIIWIDGFVNMVQNPSTDDIEAVTYALNVTERKTEQNIVSCIKEEKYDHIGLINISKRTFELRKKNWSFSNLEPNRPDDYEHVLNNVAMNHVVPEDKELFLECTRLENIAAKLDISGKYGFMFRCYDVSGKILHKQVQYNWLDAAGGIVLNTQADVTAEYEQEQKQIRQMKKALDEAEKANRAKSDFLSRMSHDIRTPLNGIIGMTYIAREQDNPQKTGECLAKIDTSSQFLLSLVNDILDMTKAESNLIELFPEPYSAEKFYGYLDAVIRPLCNEKNQLLIIDADEVKDHLPLIDILRFNQILFNLLSNSVKYTPEGGTIVLMIQPVISGEKFVMDISVKDSGIGISQEFQKVIFEPFTQEGRNDVSESRGSGLGLAIVKKLVDRMGGRIAVNSIPGKGTEFLLHLEFAYTDSDEEERQDAGDKANDTAILEGKHVLMCEDHPLNQEIVKTLLADKKVITEIAEDGRQGLEMFEDSPVGFYDAVLMDIRMPVMNGYDTAIALRKLKRPDASTIPVIAMTADAFADDVRKCMNSGMDGHISKPVEPEKLFIELAAGMKAGHRPA